MGANKANPSAMLLCSTMMLRHLGLDSQANIIATAVYDVIKEGKVRTADMHGKRNCSSIRDRADPGTGSASTSDFTKEVMGKVMA